MFTMPVLGKFSNRGNDKAAFEFKGNSRRATSFFPGEELAGSKSRLTLSKSGPLLPQLLRIESQQLSGCIKIESAHHKSRAALLVERGRGIACVYGSKATPDQIFGRDAYERILLDIASPSAVVRSYELTADVVSAAASMFHGGIFNATKTGAPLVSFDLCMELITKSDGPGAIVVLDQSSAPVCILYVSGGKIMAVNSLNPSIKNAQSVRNYLTRNPGAKVMANSMSFEHYCAISDFSFALLRLDAAYTVTSATEARGRQAAQLVQVSKIKPVVVPSYTPVDRFVKGQRRNMAATFNGIQALNHPYRIDPA